MGGQIKVSLNCLNCWMTWYLPNIPRFKCLFVNVNDAKNLMWHANGRKSDGLLWHITDSPQWKIIDTLYP